MCHLHERGETEERRKKKRIIRKSVAKWCQTKEKPLLSSVKRAQEEEEEEKEVTRLGENDGDEDENQQNRIKRMKSAHSLNENICKERKETLIVCKLSAGKLRVCVCGCHDCGTRVNRKSKETRKTAHIVVVGWTREGEGRMEDKLKEINEQCNSIKTRWTQEFKTTKRKNSSPSRKTCAINVGRPWEPFKAHFMAIRKGKPQINAKEVVVGRRKRIDPK